MTDYEYAVMQRGFPGLHRGPADKEWCEEWVREWDEEIARELAKGLFYVVRRTVGEWETYE